MPRPKTVLTEYIYVYLRPEVRKKVLKCSKLLKMPYSHMLDALLARISVDQGNGKTKRVSAACEFGKN